MEMNEYWKNLEEKEKDEKKWKQYMIRRWKSFIRYRISQLAYTYVWIPVDKDDQGFMFEKFVWYLVMTRQKKMWILTDEMIMHGCRHIKYLNNGEKILQDLVDLPLLSFELTTKMSKGKSVIQDGIYYVE